MPVVKGKHYPYTKTGKKAAVTQWPATSFRPA